MNRPAYLLLIFLLCKSLEVNGYEVETHGAITRQVYDRSKHLFESGSALLSVFGVEVWARPTNINEPIGMSYYDLQGIR